MSPVLQIFNEKTIAALKCHPKLEPSPGTATFIEKIFGILPTFSLQTLEKRFKCSSKSAIYTQNGHNLNKLIDIATLAHEMTNRGGQRIKTLTKDTSNALFQTCHELRELSIHLLVMSFSVNFLQIPQKKLSANLGKVQEGHIFSLFEVSLLNLP